MLSIVLLWGVVYLSGMLICKIGREKETSQLWKHLVGFFFLFFCQGCLFFVGQLAGWSFRQSRQYLTGVFAIVSVLSVVICHKEIGKLWLAVKSFSLKKLAFGRYRALIFWLFLGLVLVVTTANCGNRNDAMVEIVQTTLLTDTINQFHPFTRQPLELGVIMSKKLITLPFWYSALSSWTGLTAVDTVWGLGSLVTVLFSLMAFGELSGLLFFRDFRKSWLLIVLMELMYLSGDYYVGAAGYRQLFYGYSGEVIVATIMIPGVLCILYRFFGPILRKDFSKEKEGISWWGMLVELGICMGSCFFMTSVAWGLMLVAISMVLFMLSIVGVRLTKREKRNEPD